jgi:hypothetical protein
MRAGLAVVTADGLPAAGPEPVGAPPAAPPAGARVALSWRDRARTVPPTRGDPPEERWTTGRSPGRSAAA